MKKLVLLVALTLGIATGGAMLAQPAHASAIDQARQGAGKVKTGGTNSSSVSSILQVVTNVLLFIAGAVAVIMLVLGGIRYTASNGDQNQITQAKNTIMYAVVGLIVTIIAYAVVDFVIDQFI